MSDASHASRPARGQSFAQRGRPAKFTAKMVREAVEKSRTRSDAAMLLGTSLEYLRHLIRRFNLPRIPSGRTRTYSDEAIRRAIAESRTLTEAAEALGMRHPNYLTTLCKTRGISHGFTNQNGRPKTHRPKNSDNDEPAEVPEAHLTLPLVDVERLGAKESFEDSSDPWKRNDKAHPKPPFTIEAILGLEAY